MQIVLEIPDDELKRAIISAIAERYVRSASTDYGIRTAVTDAAKELVYPQKSEIIEKCVERASKELVRKGMPKLLETMTKEAKEE